jgi:CRISPR-associated protein Cmr2
MPIYTSISFAPVQGFIEKSRKLRDLYGASLILSYLSQKIVKEVEKKLGEGSVISPGLIDHQEGMPNRILVRGELTREIVEKVLLTEWQRILRICREWIENNIGIPKEQYHWSQKEDQAGKEKGEWERWGSYTWEIFMGWGRPDPAQPDKDLIKAAMDDLETRKLKRDWVAVNWVGESSSLSGTDAIAWHRLGEKRDLSKILTTEERLKEKEDQELFYRRLSWLLDDPKQRKGKARDMSLEKLRAYEQPKPDGIGRYIAVNERLSIPELVKRLITYDCIDANEPDDQKLGIAKLKKHPDDPEFKDIYREAGYWTGWFMGDGDHVGDKLKQLAKRNLDKPERREQDLLRFSELMRGWGQEFEQRKDLFPGGKGRVVYAGGDDFMGVLYSEETQTEKKPEKLKPVEAWNWLVKLPQQWKNLQDDLAQEFDFKDENRFTYSVGFVWAGHQVPQRDILQHCREAKQRAKGLGRDRLTIRVVFNSGQYVQWTCLWSYLDILTKYRDRDGSQNWAHIYSDWADLKARHAIRLQELEGVSIKKEIALALFNLYFDGAGEEFTQQRKWDELTGGNRDRDIVHWIDDLIQVGWQLCRKNPSNF